MEGRGHLRAGETFPNPLAMGFAPAPLVVLATPSGPKFFGGLKVQ